MEGYGLTEASPVVTSGTGHAAPEGSIGVPLPGVHVRLVDADGQDSLVGDAGEIWVKGPNVFAGYWNDPEATRGALTDDGWLRTGDIAVVDDDGFLFLVDRVKDLIIVSGFNVYPAEVEEVIAAHPAVAAGRGDRRAPPALRRGREGLRRRRARRERRGGRHHPPLRGPPGPVQVPAEGDVRRRDPAERHRQGAAQGAPRRPLRVIVNM